MINKKIYYYKYYLAVTVHWLFCLVLEIIKLLLESYDKKLMNARDSKKYRHKGLRTTHVNTVMGEVKYRRAMYEIEENCITKTVYLLDEKLNISAEGNVSSNLVEKGNA